MEKSKKSKYDLEQRLVEFAVRIIDLAEALGLCQKSIP